MLRSRSVERGRLFEPDFVDEMQRCGRMRLWFAEPGSHEWEHAWNGLRWALREYGLGDGSDVAQANPTLGDVWQYMGTARMEGHGMPHLDDPAVWAEFRHRAHPTGHEALPGLVTYPRVYLSVRPIETPPPISPPWPMRHGRYPVREEGAN